MPGWGRQQSVRTHRVIKSAIRRRAYHQDLGDAVERVVQAVTGEVGWATGSTSPAMATASPETEFVQVCRRIMKP